MQLPNRQPNRTIDMHDFNETARLQAQNAVCCPSGSYISSWGVTFTKTNYQDPIFSNGSYALPNGGFWFEQTVPYGPFNYT